MSSESALRVAAALLVARKTFDTSGFTSTATLPSKSYDEANQKSEAKTKQSQKRKEKKQSERKALRKPASSLVRSCNHKSRAQTARPRSRKKRQTRASQAANTPPRRISGTLRPCTRPRGPAKQGITDAIQVARQGLTSMIFKPERRGELRAEKKICMSKHRRLFCCISQGCSN